MAVRKLFAVAVLAATAAFGTALGRPWPHAQHRPQRHAKGQRRQAIHRGRTGGIQQAAQRDDFTLDKLDRLHAEAEAAADAS